MKERKPTLLILAAASLLLAACAGGNNADSSKAASSSSSSSSSTSQESAKSRYSLAVETDREGVSVVDLDGNPLLGEYEEDTKVSFKIMGAESYSIRVILNEFQLKNVEGVYSFVMARNSVLSIETELKNYYVTFSGETKIKEVFVDKDGNELDDQSGSYLAGDDVYFVLSPLASSESLTHDDVLYFYDSCYTPSLNGKAIDPDENGVYALPSLSGDAAISITSHRHDFSAESCAYCHKTKEELAIHETQETAEITYNSTLKGWKIAHTEGLSAAEIVIRKDYLLSLFDAQGDELQLCFGNGDAFGEKDTKGNAMITPVNIYTRSGDASGKKGSLDVVKRLTEFGDDSSADQKGYFSIYRNQIEEEGIDGNLYIYVNFAGNYTYASPDVCPAIFLYGIASPKAPSGLALFNGDTDSYGKSVCEYTEGVGYKLTPASDSANKDTMARGIIPSSALSFYKKRNKSKITFVFSEPFDGSSSHITTTAFSSFTWNGKATNIATNVLIGTGAAGAFDNDGKTIGTYSLTYDLAAALGENWDSSNIYVVFGFAFAHTNQLQDPSAYIHAITFAE